MTFFVLKNAFLKKLFQMLNVSKSIEDLTVFMLSIYPDICRINNGFVLIVFRDKNYVINYPINALTSSLKQPKANKSNELEFVLRSIALIKSVFAESHPVICLQPNEEKMRFLGGESSWTRKRSTRTSFLLGFLLNLVKWDNVDKK